MHADNENRWVPVMDLLNILYLEIIPACLFLKQICTRLLVCISSRRENKQDQIPDVHNFDYCIVNKRILASAVEISGTHSNLLTLS